jgi:hypothetical protein
MAKSTNGGTTKGTSGETKAQRTPVRRRTDKKSADTRAASAADVAPTKPAAQLQAAAAAGATVRAPLDAGDTPGAEAVRRRAYELYVRRGGGQGGHLDDWYEAERQLRKSTKH